MGHKSCLLHEALAMARRDLEWLGLDADHARLRSCAAARLRFTSLTRPDEASLLAGMARELEMALGPTCSYCGAPHHL